MDNSVNLSIDLSEVPVDFDSQWYLEAYPDVAKVGMDPAHHYAWIGKKLGRRPSSLSTPALTEGIKAGPDSIGRFSVETVKSVPEIIVDSGLPQMPLDPIRWARSGAHIARNSPRPLAPLFRSFNPDAMNLHWIVSGELPLDSRQARIFSLIRHLEAMGHKQWVWIQPPCNVGNEVIFRDALMAQGMLSLRTIVRFLPEDVVGISGDAVIATDFWSCFPAAAMPLFKARFRLVQFEEAECQSNGSTLALAKRAKNSDFMHLCAGQNLREVFSETELWARSWPEFADEQFFFPSSIGSFSPPEEPIQLAVDLGAASTCHIATELTLEALEFLAQRGVDFTAHILGEVPAVFAPSYSIVQYGLLGPQDRGDIFRRCHIGISLATCLDSTAHTEMLACGLLTVGLNGQGIDASGRLSLVKASPVDIVETILSVASKNKSPETKESAGLSINCREAVLAVEAHIKEGLGYDNKPITIAHAMCSAGYEYKAAVIIPTWNGGALFKDVLESLSNQSTPWSFDVMVVDSGSSDETLDLVRSYSDRGIRLHTIPNSQFQHGGTRNLAISLTSAEFVAVLTQDATPANEHWLANLVKGFEKGPKIAGVFGAHRAYPEATPFVSLGIEGHFEHFNRLPHVAHWDAEEEIIPFGSVSWQNWLHYYSDNNSCMRRSVWEHIPYPNIDWGEDQVWAWEIIKQGYEKSYASDAIVYHSHNLNNEQQFKVSKIEGAFWFQHFNYKFESSVDAIMASDEYLRNRNLEFSKHNKIEDGIVKQQISLDSIALKARYLGQEQFIRDIYKNNY